MNSGWWALVNALIGVIAVWAIVLITRRSAKSVGMSAAANWRLLDTTKYWICTECGSVVARKYENNHVSMHAHHLAVKDAIRVLVDRSGMTDATSHVSITIDMEPLK